MGSFRIGNLFLILLNSKLFKCEQCINIPVRKCDSINMKELTLNEIKSIELGILKYIRDICESNNLSYYLAYGTLIGAVRHNGFIPWDDDVDIFMPREDYYKFVSVCNEKPHDFYKIVSYETNRNYTSALPKMIDCRTLLIQNYSFIERVELGVYVDIFILDGIGNTYDEALELEKRGIMIEKKWNRADTKLFPPCSKNKLKDIMRWIRNIPTKIIGISYYVEQMKLFGEERSFYSCEYVSRFCFENDNKAEQQIWKREWFDEIVYFKFENDMFRIPAGYDAFLKTQYNDYMQLPPIYKRISNHSYKAYMRDCF